MQRYAVGLEQIAWDQEDYGLEFRKQFKDTEYNLRSVSIFLIKTLQELVPDYPARFLLYIIYRRDVHLKEKTRAGWRFKKRERKKKSAVKSRVAQKIAS